MTQNVHVADSKSQNKPQTITFHKFYNFFLLGIYLLDKRSLKILFLLECKSLTCAFMGCMANKKKY